MLVMICSHQLNVIIVFIYHCLIIEYMQDCLMEDVEIPSRHNLLSRNKLGPFSDSEHELSTSKDCMHYDVKQYKMNSHCDEDEAGYVNFWNGM